MEDIINHPSHYQSNNSNLECIDAIEASLGPEGFQAYCIGNVYKYLWRWRYKNGVEDLKKASWYLSKIIEAESNKR